MKEASFRQLAALDIMRTMMNSNYYTTLVYANAAKHNVPPEEAFADAAVASADALIKRLDTP